MAGMTSMFRGRVASSTRRLGIGALQEAEITFEGCVVLAFGGRNAILLVEAAPGTPADAIAAAGRDVMGSLDRSPGSVAHD